MTVRVRFAPSPTGYLHIGAARTALFNFLFARKTGGKFLVRVEDTDLARSTEESTRSIFEGLEWLGLNFDEEPVFQSANATAHRDAALRLIANGKAYRDFTPKEEHAEGKVKQDIAERARRDHAEGIDHRANACRDLTTEESDRRAADGEPFAVRLKVPVNGSSHFEDMVYGEQTRDYSEIEDLVLLRSDGHPLYNLSVVCDDIAMNITHVIRGQDHLTNTHKQILIYKALETNVPRFAHLPLILAPNKAKLSKRKHGEVVSLTTYRDRGFLPEAFVNALVLFGWSPPDEHEIFTFDELIKQFDLEHIHRSNAVFNFSETDARLWTDQKAQFINAEYVRTMPFENLLPYIQSELESVGLWRDEYAGERRAWFEATVNLIRERFYTLKDFSGQGRAYFADDFPFDAAAVKKNLKKDERLRELLPALAEKFSSLEPFTHDATEAAMREFCEHHAVKVGVIANAARTALTGQAVGASMFHVFESIGRERAIKRLRDATSLI
ncbi:MAG: glutamate--tRNA ligase [Pyrinomonadaceae bacterium MAG19_C2-C3]|nr:glutamate--tRNA ligase [Pyrinomonadaceae bacterium MAG19_C2-C3]